MFELQFLQAGLHFLLFGITLLIDLRNRSAELELQIVIRLLQCGDLVGVLKRKRGLRLAARFELIIQIVDL